MLAAPATAGAPGPIVPRDGVAMVTADSDRWVDGPQRFLVEVAPDPAAAARPLLDPENRSHEARLLRGWWADGTAAGLAGVLYDNRDRGHSRLPPARFPQLTHIAYGPETEALDRGLAEAFLFDRITIGNSSTAVVQGPAPRSLPRLAMTSPEGPARAFQTYAANHLYVYPAHRDHGDLDMMPANWPYMIATQGSSRSDQPFVEALALTLASMRPDTLAHARDRGLVAPTLQMLLRRAQSGVEGEAGYLSGRAHPPVFDAARLRVGQMMALAQQLTPEDLPPMVTIAVLEEDFEGPGADPAGLSERLFDTPAAVARLWRGTAHTRRIALAARAGPDIGTGAGEGEVLRFRWVLLRGDPDRVRIAPQDPSGATAMIEIDWHDRRPDAPRSPRQTDRVDIGIFADTGRQISAPAFLTVAFPGHQARLYEPAPEGGHRLATLDHDARARGRAFDPVLWWQAGWRDIHLYDAAGQPAGILREFSDGSEAILDARGQDPEGRQPALRLGLRDGVPELFHDRMGQAAGQGDAPPGDQSP